MLSGCAVDTIDRLKEVGKIPELNQVTYPNARYDYRPVEYPNNNDSNDMSLFEPRNKNSLWQPGSRTFFRDQRSRRVGDIVKVVIKISDKADLNNKTESRRGSKEHMGSNNLFGLENKVATVLTGGAIDPTNLINIAGSNNHNGEGKIARKENIETQIAAIITQILPNGNLVLKGTQEVRVNNEIREIYVEGIARTEDIGLDNSISSDQIAEARISYGGRGHITNVQQPRIGSQIIDIISPF